LDLCAWLRLPICDCTIVLSTENAVPQKLLRRNQLKYRKIPVIDRRLAAVRADGAYDRASVYCAIENHASYSPVPTCIFIPPAGNAKTSNDAGIDSDQRDKNIQRIDRVDRRAWQRESGYTRRSLVETAVSRFKNEFGSTIRSRTMRSQAAEIRIACSILNTMTKLGMPNGHCVS
jgi:hypothetical protein